MTNTIDNFWISLGIDASELTAVKGREAIYAALFTMSAAAAALICGIAANLMGAIS